jgi:hypothetical protein
MQPIRAPLVALVLVLGCGDSLAPEDLRGVYVLRSIAGEPLPTVAGGNEWLTIHALADTLRFGSDGRGTRSVVQETVTHADGARSGRAHGQQEFFYHIVRGRVEIGFPCPPNANCMPPPHLVARRAAGGLTVEAPRQTLRAPMRYARVE